MNADTMAVLALSLAPGLGNVAVNEVLIAAAQAEAPLHELLELPKRQQVEALPPGPGTAAYSLSRCEEEHRRRAGRLLERVGRAGGQALLVTDSDYPSGLEACLGTSAPPILFAVGNLDLLHTPCAAIVGARRATASGLRIAQACAEAFAPERIPVVSGGAQGVDTAAHAAALGAGGETVVVLPQGLLTYRGPANLMRAVEDGFAALVSEFVPDDGWASHAAVRRNATISALARLVCVIEPKKEGGSIRTARCALDQGKRVLIHCREGASSPMASLLRAGALPLLDDGGAFCAGTLMNHWRAAPEPVPEQSDLL